MLVAATLLTIAIIVAVLLAVALGLLTIALKSIEARAKGAATGSVGPTSPPPYQQPVDQLTKELARIVESGEVTSDDCARLRSLHASAESAGAPADILDELKKAVDAACADAEGD